MNDNMNNNMNNSVNNPNLVQNGMNNQQIPVQPMVQNQVPQQPLPQNYQQPMAQPTPMPMGMQPSNNMNQSMQPNNKKRDNIIVIIIGLVVVGIIVAILVLLLAGNSDDKEKEPSSNNDNVITENDDGDDNDNNINDDIDNGNNVDNNNTVNDNSSSSTNLPNDWTSMEFIFDGVKYTLRTPYSTFAANGWKIDLNKMGYQNGYAVKPNVRVVSTVYLYNSKYSDSYVSVGFINNDTVEKDITECDVWSFGVRNTYADTPISFELPGGIKNGSTAAEVEAAYGKLEEKDLYRSESLKYTLYTYSYDYNKYLKLTVYDDGGLKEFSYQVYR